MGTGYSVGISVTHETGSRQTSIEAGRGRVALAQGDITSLPADAIVNAANAALAGGGGVDGAIHRAGGPSIMAELRERYEGCPTGGAVVTGAGALPARWVIHAVGPRWQGGHRGEPELLRSAYREALARADEIGARSVTLPAISAGIYGYPLDQAAAIAVATVHDHLRSGSSIEQATFVLYSAETLHAFERAVAALEVS
jgi:O-acetyl-ADP-ribose deacetylase (regulator of RNase III)